MTLTCPVCSMDVNPEEEFAPLDKLHQYRPIIRHFNIPILLRLSGSPRSALGTHLAQSSRLIGYPRLLHLPNLISPKGLFHVVEMLYPQVNGFDLCFVDSQVCLLFLCFAISSVTKVNFKILFKQGIEMSSLPLSCALQWLQDSSWRRSSLFTARRLLGCSGLRARRRGSGWWRHS